MEETCIDCGEKIKEKFQQCKLNTIGTHAFIYNMCDKNIIKKKFFKKNRELEMKSTLEKLNKPYFVKILDINEDSMILSKVNGMDFKHYFAINIGMNEEKKFNIFIKIFKVLLDLEKSGYNHLDISPGNILIENQTNNIFIIDYINLTNDRYFYREFMGSYGYVPPEKLVQKKFIFNKFDCYSFGMLIADHIALNYHFQIMNFKKKCNCFNNCSDLQSCLNRKIDLVLERVKSDKIKNIYRIILSNTLVIDYNKRKSFRELETLLTDFL